MNLANLGLSGLNAAQNRLQTAGHNINNAATEGYNRQSVLSATAGASATSAGYIGRGVQAVTVQRAYDSFLFRQLTSAQTTGASLAAYGTEITQINNLFADRTVGITPALQKFFDGIQAVASAPADSAARQELLGRASSLVGQINDSNAFLDDQRGNINTQITTVVTQINSYAERIRDLNTQITTARATASQHEPNDLLDQRDQLVAELSQLVGVKVIEQDGNFNLTVGNGQILLGGDTVFPLHAQPSADDPARTVVAYTAPVNGDVVAVELPDSSIKGGTLGGLLDYRREALDSVQNKLGRLAVGLATAINTVHRTGEDLHGIGGGDFFTLGPVTSMPGPENGGGAVMSAQFTDANQLTGQDYRIERTVNGYTVTSLPNGKVSTFTDSGDPANPTAIEVDGISFNVSGAPDEGDSWLVQPTRSAAANLALAIDDPAAIAMATPGSGTSNGDVGLELAKLQTSKVLGDGSMSLNEAFSQIVNHVGVMTQKNSTSAKAQATLIQQNYAAQQAVSGVNLNEEYVRLDQYQEQFRAASRLIDVSSSLFDTLLGLRN
ncbi:flagellar hook-associated protein FlgK [Pollutimonas harenae]|uniref:Flagellar hook-associated protein 1 n=1 Tax=Pollutimonas harenae TaxID=657015 RepID=A0A853H4C1_9BURK|nr:flagellar hook-associated protein FlgK [Pollutimonas harenae]NYT87062.1 flagellar hook-associated protein FlgK [Pollutimonas harenae]TEA71281.1 flagellar hook-associated protein FlgK [Pollutimonas harenae]